MKQTEQNLTEGNIYKSLISFSIPFIIANLMQALYGTADLLIVGLFTDTVGLSSVAIGTQVMQIVNGLITGLTMGGTILVGQYYGARKNKDTSETIGTMLTLGIFISLLITGLMFISTKHLLNILQTPSEAYADATRYVLIASSGIIFIFGYNSISAILRGLGDSKRPVYFIAIACVFNIVLDLILVGAFNMRAAGAALATIVSQGISMILAIIYLSRRKFIFEFKRKNFIVNKDKMLKLLKLGGPLSLQEVLLWMSFLVIAAIANSLGVSESAAVGIVAKFEVFSMLPPMAMSYALASLTAQNIGANQPERASKALNISILISLVCSLFFFVWAQLHPQSIMGIFKADKDVVKAGTDYLKTFSIDFMLVAIKFNLNGFLNGSGRTTFAMINGILSSILVRVPMAFLLAITFLKGLIGLGLAAPIASVVSIVVSTIYIRTNKWKEKVI
ncbi:putative efflux protein, MATE family [Gottschalkia purinilytica]|uniref:Probable multidrug resistance protein NorM n=1 Tax=Gottschalkia purinilytica TaxID=1503 RepID=A0A0L0W8C4_GOTPU|nr:MATE family efflux transporter [Gottschalkia purinilytica]KNF07701.1 putative efflux protein, MATE family [Gottschalkia purinilytica]